MLEISLLFSEFEKKIFAMRSSMFNAPLTLLSYRSTNRLAGLNPNISVNTREEFKLTGFVYKTPCVFMSHYHSAREKTLFDKASQQIIRKFGKFRYTDYICN